MCDINGTFIVISGGHIFAAARVGNREGERGGSGPSLCASCARNLADRRTNGIIILYRVASVVTTMQLPPRDLVLDSST